VSQLDGAGTDVTPLFFLVTGLIDCWAIFRGGLLRLVPVAREQIVDTVPDAVLVVDPGGVLIDVNPAAERLLRRLRPELDGDLVGRPLPEVAGPTAVAVLAPPSGSTATVSPRSGRGSGWTCGTPPSPTRAVALSAGSSSSAT
jgi:PAS domain-containing protein